MPPLRGYTVGMTRRSLAFPPRARNTAAGGLPSQGGGEGGRGARAAAPPRPPAAGAQPRDCGNAGGQPTKFSSGEAPASLCASCGAGAASGGGEPDTAASRPLPARQEATAPNRPRPHSAGLRATLPSGRKPNTECPRLRLGSWAFFV